MVKSSELRLNNWINDGAGLPKKVAYIGETIGLHNEMGGTDKYQLNPIYSGDINDLSPIPLTPEILEKAGYSLLEEDTYIIKDLEYPHDREAALGNYSVNCYKGQWKIMNGCGNNEYVVFYLLYLHELQNWHHLVTGEELEINLTNIPKK